MLDSAHLNSEPEPARQEAEPEETETEPDIGRPSYWTLRVAGYGFLWTMLLLLPFLLLVPNQRTLYLPSAGFALFLGAVLAPFGASTVRHMDWKQARALFGSLELSFWLRTGAILAVTIVWFATSVSKIDEWINASKAFVALIFNLS